MRSLLPVLSALLCAGASAFAQETVTPTALKALQLLPKGEAKRLARIEAHDGKPAPDRWHILVHDPEEKTGIREYVIAGDEIVAARGTSQFAETLTESDIIGAEAIRIDSDKASKLAQQYALENNATVATMNYELIREGDGAAPLWKISCVDESGKTVGSLILTASKGTVVAHDGFPVQPVASQEKLTVEADTVVGDAERADPPPITDESTPVAPPTNSSADNGKSASTTKAAATPKKKTPTKTPKRQVEDENEGEGRPRFFRRAGGKLQKFFTGRDTISR